MNSNGDDGGDDFDDVMDGSEGQDTQAGPTHNAPTGGGGSSTGTFKSYLSSAPLPSTQKDVMVCQKSMMHNLRVGDADMVDGKLVATKGSYKDEDWIEMTYTSSWYEVPVCHSLMSTSIDQRSKLDACAGSLACSEMSISMKDIQMYEQWTQQVGNISTAQPAGSMRILVMEDVNGLMPVNDNNRVIQLNQNTNLPNKGGDVVYPSTFSDGEFQKAGGTFFVPFWWLKANFPSYLPSQTQDGSPIPEDLFYRWESGGARVMAYGNENTIEHSCQPDGREYVQNMIYDRGYKLNPYNGMFSVASGPGTIENTAHMGRIFSGSNPNANVTNNPEFVSFNRSLLRNNKGGSDMPKLPTRLFIKMRPVYDINNAVRPVYAKLWTTYKSVWMFSDNWFIGPVKSINVNPKWNTTDAPYKKRSFQPALHMSGMSLPTDTVCGNTVYKNVI